MKITKNAVPSVTYVLTVDGEVIDQAKKETPLNFIFGVGGMIPGFESNLDGLETGNSYDFTLSPDEAYGEYNKTAIVDLPKSTFNVDGKVQEDMLAIGKVIPMQDQNGNPLNGTVVEIIEDTVKMDFNHVLAGKSLHFAGEVIDVREASKEELEHGHVHGLEEHNH